MRSIRKNVLGLGFGLLIVIVVTALLPSIKNRWIRLSGAVFLTNASRTHTFMDEPMRILSVGGQRWVTSNKLEAASAYHALVLFPSVSISDNGSTSSGGNYNHSFISKWLVQGNGEKELEIIYDAMWQTITVDSQTFHLKNGNLFVIRFGESWKPKVTQFNQTISKTGEIREHDRLRDAFKFLLPEDKMVQQLL